MKTGYNKISDPRLKRYVPTDFNHVEKYPLRFSNMPTTPVPVTVGVNWYSSFDNPTKDRDGKWWAGKDHNRLGYIRGGHCVCMPHIDNEPYSWYTYYNQGREGACVGFGSSRMMSLLNRVRYDARWLWDRAKEVDEWSDTNPGDNEGTSVRAAMDILRTRGHKLMNELYPHVKHGINRNVWATHMDQTLTALGNEQYKKIGAIPFFNNWGKDYPRKVWVPVETWQRLMDEWGEFTIVTDNV